MKTLSTATAALAVASLLAPSQLRGFVASPPAIVLEQQQEEREGAAFDAVLLSASPILREIKPAYITDSDIWHLRFQIFLHVWDGWETLAIVEMAERDALEPFLKDLREVVASWITFLANSNESRLRRLSELNSVELFRFKQIIMFLEQKDWQNTNKAGGRIVKTLCRNGYKRRTAQTELKKVRKSLALSEK